MSTPHADESKVWESPSGPTIKLVSSVEWGSVDVNTEKLKCVSEFFKYLIDEDEDALEFGYEIWILRKFAEFVECGACGVSDLETPQLLGLFALYVDCKPLVELCAAEYKRRALVGASKTAAQQPTQECLERYEWMLDFCVPSTS
jgi:hypothetical protein